MQPFKIFLSIIGRLLLLLALETGASEFPNSTIVIKYPNINEERNQEYTRYFLEVLQLGLAKSNVKYSLEPVQLPYISESRSVRNLEAGTYTIHWLNSNADRESGLVPIRIPLFKGLIGWRLLFIREEDQPLFAKAKTVDDLKVFTAGLGHDWPDTEIFEANNIKTVTSASFRGLFRMLPAKRIDYFPRSVIEIERERKLHPDMYLENTLVIHYPSAYYFFVDNENENLAAAIEAGLSVAIKTGEFDKLFNSFYGATIARANLSGRKIIRLSNPQKFPLDQKVYWYNLPN